MTTEYRHRVECSCDNCKHHKYNEEFDAFYCKLRNVWLENKCSNKDCNFCNLRPDKPLKEVKKK